MQSDNTRGALLMMAAMAAFTVNDAIMKVLSAELPLFQSLFMRGVVVSLVLGLIARRAGALSRAVWAAMGPTDRRLVILRTAADALGTWFFLQALFSMPLANMTAIFQALPLAVTLGAALFLGENVGWRRMAAISVGFFGVMLIVRPDAGGFDLYAIYALTSVVLITVRELATRRLARAVPSLLVAFANAAAVMAFGLVGMLGTGAMVMPSIAATGWATLTALFIVGGYLGTVMAVRTGEMGFVTPFRYTALVWALVLGFVVFGDWPDPVTALGAALIVGTGLFTFYRERLRGRPKGRAPLGR